MPPDIVVMRGVLSADDRESDGVGADEGVGEGEGEAMGMVREEVAEAEAEEMGDEGAMEENLVVMDWDVGLVKVSTVVRGREVVMVTVVCEIESMEGIETEGDNSDEGCLWFM